jgi:hypothetical protein
MLWMKEHAGELGAIAHRWFEVMRKCGDGPEAEAALVWMAQSKTRPSEGSYH